MNLIKIIILILIVWNPLRCANLKNKVQSIEKRLDARVGVSLYDVATKKELWSYKGSSRFPLMSTFKTLACAKLLYDVQKKRRSLDFSVFIRSTSLLPWSPVTKNYVGKKFSLKQACQAMMVMSDNTAANIVLKKIGGPKNLTKFMRLIDDNVTRLDRFEPELGEAIKGDVRDTTTPNAMAKSLYVLFFSNLLSSSSKRQLKRWMMDNKVSDNLFRLALPKGWKIADRSGAGGYGSRGITAIVWSKTKTPMIICVYMTQTKAPLAQRDKAIMEIGKEIFTLYQ